MMPGKRINTSMIAYSLLMRKKKINWYTNSLRVRKSEKFVCSFEASAKVMDRVRTRLLVNRHGSTFRGVNRMSDKEKHPSIYHYRHCPM